MFPETMLLMVCLALAFGGVPLATLVHAHIATMRAARHIAEIESLAAAPLDARERHAESISRLGVLQLQALAMAAAGELKDRGDDGARGGFRPRDRRHCHRPPPLAKAG